MNIVESAGEKVKIVQIIAQLHYGDGVSRCALSLIKLLNEFGYENELVTLFLDHRIHHKQVKQIENIDWYDINEADILMYHFYDGFKLNFQIEKMTNRKILIYQNVTSPKFFRGISENVVKGCLLGIYDAYNTVGNYLKCITMSEFSKKSLISMGWNPHDIEVVPLIPLNQGSNKASEEVLEKYRDKKTNILFTGRIAPNKKIEDIINIFVHYKDNYDADCRLFLVGRIYYQNYYKALLRYIKKIGGKEIIFTDHITEEELESYYIISDIFLCMSEHEGFCIPLIEAMQRDIPVIAYNAAAVPDTMGDAGILFNTKEKETVCAFINKIMCDRELKENVIQKQRERVKYFNLVSYKERIRKLLAEVMTKSVSQKENDKAVFDNIYIEKDDAVATKRELDLCEIEGMSSIVIYGLGKVGKNLAKKIKEKYSDKIVAICDNHVDYINYEGISIFKHEECIRNYPQAVYIITVQKLFISIVADLLNSGICKKNIKFYDSARHIIID